MLIGTFGQHNHQTIQTIAMLRAACSRLYRVVKSQSVKPGKGVAYMQAELKELTTGHKINRRFRSSESVKKAPLTKDRSFQFLYNDGNKLVLMEPSTFEQVGPGAELRESHGLEQLEVGTDILQENQLKYLSEGTMVTLQIVEGTPLWMNLPDHVVHIVEVHHDPTVVSTYLMWCHA
ncbi:hypothetical protein DYB32_009962 [Aphanomyces invadans]|uniref:Translation elongation factor P/YeiP central domain-containing protein n=1 Tax=Aphanomyces invadans TaxID=157072 RepID=A0A3R6VGM3_9STRA|nr:hypothetical protein DYB32_009962 [Aphanomyces invadans]